MFSLDVGIVGAGTAGAAAAIFLARSGHRVTVYERVPEPAAIGAGITIQPTGLHVLERLGLHDPVVARGSRIRRLFCETRARRPLVDLTYETIGPDLFGLGLHRGVLFEALLGALRREPVRLETGIEIVGFARQENRRMLVDASGHRHGPHDLVVVADGARSQLRDDAGTHKRVTPYPWGALWCIVPDPREPSDPSTAAIQQVADGNHTFLGLLPSGVGPGTAGVPLVSVFWSLRCDRVDEWRERGIESWKSDVRSLAPEAEAVLAPIEREEQMLFASYHDVVMDRWSTRSIVYLGDAAHATSPQLGQGSNLALWDAMVLGDELERETHDLGRALDRYTRARCDHLAFYQLATRWLTPFFQGDVAALGVLRDLAMPLMGRIPLSKQIMTAAMLGITEGFFGGRLHCPTLP